MIDIEDGSFIAVVKRRRDEVLTEITVGEKRGGMLLHPITLYCGSHSSTMVWGRPIPIEENRGLIYSDGKSFIDAVSPRLSEEERINLAGGCHAAWLNTDPSTSYHQEMESIGSLIHDYWKGLENIRREILRPVVK